MSPRWGYANAVPTSALRLGFVLVIGKSPPSPDGLLNLESRIAFGSRGGRYGSRDVAVLHFKPAVVRAVLLRLHPLTALHFRDQPAAVLLRRGAETRLPLSGRDFLGHQQGRFGC